MNILNGSPVYSKATITSYIWWLNLDKYHEYCDQSFAQSYEKLTMHIDVVI